MESKTETVSDPQFWYEWGNEQKGYVSTGCYINDVLHSTGQIKKEEVVKLRLPFNCPYS